MAALAKKLAYKAKFLERPPATTFQDIDTMIEQQNAEILLKKKWKSLCLSMQWTIIQKYIEIMSLSDIDMTNLKKVFRKKELMQTVDYDVDTNSIKCLNYTLVSGKLI